MIHAKFSLEVQIKTVGNETKYEESKKQAANNAVQRKRGAWKYQQELKDFVSDNAGELGYLMSLRKSADIKRQVFWQIVQRIGLLLQFLLFVHYQLRRNEKKPTQNL